MSDPAPEDRPNALVRLFRYVNLRWRIGEWLRRAVLALARRFRPVWPRGSTVWVLRAADVRSVMENPTDFSVVIFGMRQSETMGLTFLGMDPSEQYSFESGAMRAALEVPDARPGYGGRAGGPERIGRLSWVRGFAAGLSQERVEEALKTKSEIDVVSDLADVVPLSFAREFFGTPEPDPDRPEILHWLKMISYYNFAPASSEWAVPAQRAGHSIRAHFEWLVEKRRDAVNAGEDTPNDVLGRLMAAGLSNDVITRSLGFISGAMMPTSWLFIEVVDRLMRLGRRQREELHRCAVEGDAKSVRDYVIEAARFFPFPFFIIRFAERDVQIGGRRIPHNSTVNLVIGSATMDSRAVKRAGRFVPGRPESEYMLFGHDVHFCQGKDIAEQLMTQMAMALFSRENLRRAPGLRGYICKGPKGVIPDGYYPRSLILKADG